MNHLEAIIAHGNHPHRAGRANRITCTDGFNLSVIAGKYAYCTPRPGFSHDAHDDYPGPYTEVEVGFPSERPEPFDQWGEWCDDPTEPTKTVYGYVPVEAVRALIESHGGEA